MPATPHESRRGNRLDRKTEPWPEGETFTVHAVALLFHKKRQTIYNTLSTRAREFTRPKYAQVFRGRHDLRLYRVLTGEDMTVLRAIFSVRVK
jgi:hypothetical protein